MCFRSLAGLGEGGQQHGRQDGDDGDDHQQFNEGELLAHDGLGWLQGKEGRRETKKREARADPMEKGGGPENRTSPREVSHVQYWQFPRENNRIEREKAKSPCFPGIIR